MRIRTDSAATLSGLDLYNQGSKHRNGEIPGVIGSAVRPGWKTTEFWLAVIPLGALLLLLGLGRITPEDVSGLWPLLVPAGGYGISRGLAK